MAEAVGLTASVIAIIDLSAKVATLCLQYSTAVRNAKADITRLQTRLNDLGTSLEGVKELLDDRNNQALATSRKLVDSLDGCTSELAQLQSKLDPGKARQAMRHFGLRALKWPFNSKEVSGIVSNLDHYKQTIILCLQVDQTSILLDIHQRLEAVSLQPGDKSIACTPCFSVPFDRDPDFVDRPDIMAWMKEQYAGSAGRLALVGMGGFGKSQVAIQFAHHIHDTSPQTSVFWVHASSKPRFEEAYRSIAERLRLPKRNNPDVDVLRLVCDWLQTEEAGAWVMVLDNVDDVNLFYPSPNAGGNKGGCCAVDGNPTTKNEQRPLAALLPKRRNGTILVTSRSMDAAEKLTGSHKAVYRISTMDDTQGFQLLRNKLKGDFDMDAAADLLRALNYIPLAVTQAAAYINRRAPRASVKTYLDTFRESDKKKGSLLNRDAGDLRRDETVSNSVFTTWQVTFEQIRRERPSAANLLSFMSFFNPQRIPEFVLHNYDTDLTDNVDRDAESDDFEDDLEVLRGYSLVSVTAAQDVCEVHSLVQFCTRAWISVVDDAKRWRRVFLRAMSRQFLSGAFETWPTCQMLLPHIEPTFEEEPPNEDLQSWACLLTKCAWYMSTTGNYRVAENLGGRTVETWTKVLGEEHPDTLMSMNNLALTYRNQGRWKETEELLVRGIETTKRGEEHPDTLISMANLAWTYKNQGRWKEAEELEVRVMEMAKTVLGEEHPNTLTIMRNLAITWKDQGHTRDALALIRSCVVLRERVLGTDHPHTASSAAILAEWENMSDSS
ncbi:Kinesin light chain [Fusarium oxysporum f. sp. raphani]|uniref:Kinesin light chain n=1 Tax=Fusarium oxysporum f. sp. raphani TaxID=96318 RepID=A0A8J5UN85_FUSOX|nr:Kinesin light chain [Fusarium oxysporum f. sp. raphani]